MNEHDDPDFAQRMHFIGPAGHEPCTRPEWPHEGPCAHPLKRCHYNDPDRHLRCKISHDHREEQEAIEERNMLYYDGPILDFRVCEAHDGKPMLEVKAENGMFYQHDDFYTRIRFDRSDLEVGLNMLLRHGVPAPDEHEGPMDVGEDYDGVCRLLDEAVSANDAWFRRVKELVEKKRWYESTYPDRYPRKGS